MNNEINLEKYRKLSVAALVTGLLTIFIGGLYNFLWLPITNFMQIYVDSSMMPYIVLPVLGVVFILAITAVVCGSIDLRRIKGDSYSRRGKGFDITGIVLGGLFILLVVWFLLGEILMPH
jgi:hypothetical protein